MSNEKVNGKDVAKQVAEEKERSVEGTIGAPANDEAEKPAQAAAPAPNAHRAQIVVTLQSDGNVQVHGPLADQPLYFWMLRTAEKIGDEYAEQQRRRHQAIMEQRAKEPFFKRKIREAREAKERAQQEQARRDAAQAEQTS